MTQKMASEGPLDEDQELVEPIYMRHYNTYQLFSYDDDSYEEVSDNDDSLDLSAPPPES